MNAIEKYYETKGVKVLSKRDANIVKQEETVVTKTVQKVEHSFIERLFNKDLSGLKVTSETGKKVISGIKNDVLLKELEEKPALISNLIQYTPANIVLNLIEGTNVKNGDLLFGVLQ